MAGIGGFFTSRFHGALYSKIDLHDIVIGGRLRACFLGHIANAIFCLTLALARSIYHLLVCFKRTLPLR